jgi:hypothetical protein
MGEEASSRMEGSSRGGEGGAAVNIGEGETEEMSGGGGRLLPLGRKKEKALRDGGVYLSLYAISFVCVAEPVGQES